MKYKTLEDLAYAAINAIHADEPTEEILALADVYFYALENAPDGLTGKLAIEYAEEQLILAQGWEETE